MRAGDVLVHDIRLVHGSYRSRGRHLRRTLYYEFQSLGWMQREGVRPGTDTRIDDTWTRARIRLTRHAIETRKACPYAAKETSFDYRVPPGFEVEPHSRENPVMLRTKLTASPNW